MSAVKRSLVSGLVVSSAALAVVAGSHIRNRVDEGGPLYTITSPATDTTGMIASQGNDIPEGDYFRDMVRLLKREYVEPIQDDQKLAMGAIRGMIGSLGDLRSQYMDAEAFKAFTEAKQGKYEGIGVSMVLEMPHGRTSVPTSVQQESESDVIDREAAQSITVPYLKVAYVAPGSPADKAGVKAGDIVDHVSGKWVPDPDRLARFTALAARVGSAEFKKLPPQKVKAIQGEYRQLGSELRPLAKTLVMPSKAKNLLTLGTTGAVDVIWKRNGKAFETTIQKTGSEVKPLENGEAGLKFAIRTETVPLLKEAIKGKTALTIDLRNNADGQFEAIDDILAVLAPAGRYGTIDSEKDGKDRPFAIKAGNASPPKLTLVVDGTTRGPAEILALALSSKGIAKLTGTKMAGDLDYIETVALPDGSGYTLVTGTYTSADHGVVLKKKAAHNLTPTKPVANVIGDSDWIAVLEDNGGDA